MKKYVCLPYLNFQFVEKNNVFLRFCLCIFESDTLLHVKVIVLSRFLGNFEIFKDLIQIVGLLY